MKPLEQRRIKRFHTRRLILCNAGHPRPILYRAFKGEWSLLGDESPSRSDGASNLPLGLMSVTEYEHFDVELEPGDCVVAYTDALIESSDADGETLGEYGVLRLFNLFGNIRPEKLIDALLGEIAERYPGNPSNHDVTVLLVRANGGAQSLTQNARGSGHGWRSPSLPLPTAARAAPANLNRSLRQN